MPLIKEQSAAPAIRDAIVLDLGDLAQQATRLKQEARDQAQRIVEEAKQQAEQIVAGH